MTDLDLVIGYHGDLSDQFLEYSYGKNIASGTDYQKFKFHGIIDYKRMNRDKVQMRIPPLGTLPVQRGFCQQFDLHFFIALTYLDPDWETKMYYLIPCIEKSIDWWQSLKLDVDVTWLSLQGYSRFLHAMRNIKWNKNEVIEAKALVDVGLPVGLTLGGVPNKIIKHPLPNLANIRKLQGR